jgi:hypothetical protein
VSPTKRSPPTSRPAEPRIPDRKALALSNDELREIRVALALRIAQLNRVDTKKMPPSQRAKLQRHIDLSTERPDAVQRTRGI